MEIDYNKKENKNRKTIPENQEEFSNESDEEASYRNKINFYSNNGVRQSSSVSDSDSNKDNISSDDSAKESDKKGNSSHSGSQGNHEFMNQREQIKQNRISSNKNTSDSDQKKEKKATVQYKLDIIKYYDEENKVKYIL